MSERCTAVMWNGERCRFPVKHGSVCGRHQAQKLREESRARAAAMKSHPASGGVVKCPATTWNGKACKLLAKQEGLCRTHLKVKCRKEGRSVPQQVTAVKLRERRPQGVHYTKRLGEYGWWPRAKRPVKASELKLWAVYLDEEGLPAVVTKLEGEVDGHRFWMAKYIWQTADEAAWPVDMPMDATVWLAQKMEPYTQE